MGQIKELESDPYYLHLLLADKALAQEIFEARKRYPWLVRLLAISYHAAGCTADRAGWNRTLITPLSSGARLENMNARVDNLLDEALTLPTGERSALVAALLDSLEGSDDPGISEAWRLEIERRRAGLRDGSAVAVPWAEARAKFTSL